MSEGESLISEAPPTEVLSEAPPTEAPPTEVLAEERLGCQHFDEEALLSKLVEQNRILEQDTRFTTQINTSPTLSSFKLAESHDQSLRSHDPLGSKDSLDKVDSTSPGSIISPDGSSIDTHQDDLCTQIPANTSPDGITPSSSATPPAVTTPTTPPSSPTPSPSWDAPSRKLDSPTEVRSKPNVSAYSPSVHMMAAVSEGEESEEAGGLGPDATIVLEDGLDTQIPYSEVVPGGTSAVGVAMGGAAPNTQDNELTEHVTDHVTDNVTDHVTDHVTEDEAAKSESRDVVAELPSTIPTGKGRRLRSETESRSSKGPSIFVPFKGRKRSHTLQEVGGAKEKEEQEDKLLSSEETQWQQWSDILKNWEEFYPKNVKVVKHLSRRGIPEPLRGMAWQLLSNSIHPELKERYPTLINEMSPHEKAIRRDLNRTFPEHSFFKERDGVGQESLFNVLKAYSVYDKEVGYCQGSPFMVGLLLMQMPEEEAFCVLVQIMGKYKMREVYKPSMADLSLCFYQLEKLIEELYPSLSMHFKAVGFQPSMYASPWFLTLFASVLSLNVAFRVMDILLMEGRDIVFKVGMALFEDGQEQLLQMDMEDMIMHFQKDLKARYSEDPDQLISKALKINLNHKKMKKFGKEYLEKKARKTLEISEMARLHTENMDVTQKLAVVQQEFDSLREQLIAGQLTRAEQAEEIVLLRNELAIMRKKLTKLESHEEVGKDQRGDVNEAAVPEWAETNGHGIPLTNAQEPHIVKVLSVSLQRSTTSGAQLEGYVRPSPPRVLAGVAGKDRSLFDIYKDSSASPQDSPMLMRGLLDRGSKENLFLEDEPPNTVEEKKKKKKNKNKLLGRSKSAKRAQEVVCDPEQQESPPLSPDSAMSKKERKKKKHSAIEHELERELVLAKTTCADYANQLEVKTLELKQALQREAFLIRELKQVRPEAEAESEAKMSPESLPDLSSTPPPAPPEDTGPNSSQALLSNLRAIWKSSPGSSKKELT